MIDVVSVGKSELAAFEAVCDSSLFDLKGVLPSEMLFLCSLATALQADSVVESGRARGVSTALISAFFAARGVPVHSVENTKYSIDARIAEARLKGRKNLSLLYGDAFVQLPRLARKLAAPLVFIDGPKGEKAVLLAASLLKNHKNIKAVLIHDCYKGSEERSLISAYFPQAISSDDEGFVAQFRHLDAPCWDKVQELGDTTIAPYVQSGRPVESYGHTVSAILNTEGVPAQCQKLFADRKVDEASLRFGLLGGLLRELKTYLPRKSYFQPL